MQVAVTLLSAELALLWSHIAVEIDLAAAQRLAVLQRSVRRGDTGELHQDNPGSRPSPHTGRPQAPGLQDWHRRIGTGLPDRLERAVHSLRNRLATGLFRKAFYNKVGSAGGPAPALSCCPQLSHLILRNATPLYIRFEAGIIALSLGFAAYNFILLFYLMSTCARAA